MHGLITTRLAELPARPGAYLFRDRYGEILYVGKARNLRRRVRSYFRADVGEHLRTRAMLERASSVEALVVRTERDALLLEAALIRTHRPRYNRKLKDSRGYPHLEIALHHPIPRVLLTYHSCDDRALHFGPFPEAGALRNALHVIRRLYTLRGASFERQHRARTAADHRRMAVDTLEFLAGRSMRLRHRIDRAMLSAARRLDFERAARLREARATLDAVAARRLQPVQGTARMPRVIARVSAELADRTPEQADRTPEQSDRTPQQSAHSPLPCDAVPPDPGSRCARRAGR